MRGRYGTISNGLKERARKGIVSAMDALTSALPYIQIVLAILLVAAVLMQQTGAGVGGAFGGGDMGGTYHTRRGLERTLFQATIVLAVLFVISAMLALVL